MAAQYIRVGNTLTNIIDSITGESVNYDLVTTWWDGTPMDDSKTDGTIYRKLGTEYFKRTYYGYADITWFGAVGDSLTDNTEAIQKAVNVAKFIYIPNKQYKVLGTISIPDNVEIFGEQGATLIGNCTDEGTGAYTTTMFTNEDLVTGNSNITFRNLIINFDRQGRNYQVGSGLTTNPAMYFENVNGLYFDNITLEDFVTNLNTDLSAETRTVRFCLLGMVNCDTILFNNFKTVRIREEGIQALSCKNISIKDWTGDGTTGQSSFGAFWYCNGLSITDADLFGQAGSVINCHSYNVIISNLKVNKGYTRSGRGIDFSNELGLETTIVSENITIENCYFNVFSYGLICGINDPAKENLYKNFRIVNNSLNVIAATTGTLIGYLRGIQVCNPQSVFVESNEIYIGDSPSAAVGCAIRLQFKASTESYGKIQIRNNTARALKFVAYIAGGIPINTTLDELTIEGNTWISQELNGMTTISGASNFIYIRDQAGSTGQMTFNRILIENNHGSNIYGGYFVDNVATCILSYGIIKILNNQFDAPPTSFMEQSLKIGNLTSLGRRILYINKNNITRTRLNRAYAFTKVFIEDNIYDYLTEDANVNAFNLYNTTDIVVFKNNILLRLASAYISINNATPEIIPTIVDIRENTSVNLAGTKHFNTTFINTGTPNELVATSTIKGNVNQGASVPNGSSIDTLLGVLRTAGIIAT